MFLYLPFGHLDIFPAILIYTEDVLLGKLSRSESSIPYPVVPRILDVEVGLIPTTMLLILNGNSKHVSNMYKSHACTQILTGQIYPNTTAI